MKQCSAHARRQANVKTLAQAIGMQVDYADRLSVRTSIAAHVICTQTAAGSGFMPGQTAWPDDMGLSRVVLFLLNTTADAVFGAD